MAKKEADKGAEASKMFDLAGGVPAIDGQLRPPPSFVDRISKRVLIVFFLFFGGILVLFLWALDKIEEAETKQVELRKVPSEDDAQKVNQNSPTELTGNGSSKENSIAGNGPTSLVQHDNQGTANDAAKAALRNAVEKNGTGKPSDKDHVPAPDGLIPRDTHAGVSGAPLTPEQQAIAAKQQARELRLAQSYSNGQSTKGFDADATSLGAASADPAGLKDLLAAAKSGSQAPLGSPPQAGGGEQDEKLAFLKEKKGEVRGYHPYTNVPAISPNEIKSGGFIPMALKQGINSDVPGVITAQVTEGVYDTVTGCLQLIPPLAVAVGTYDSKIALGQGRLLVAWNTIIFPNGDELNLAGAQGYDSSGKAGLNSDVNNHYLRSIGLTFGLSVIGAATQLSVPQPNEGANGATAQQTPSQTIAAALAQQYGQLGAQILTKQLAVQPTLTNQPGERFTIIVPNTIVFRTVWRQRC
jgi:type IV secretory pathway VirB10-like protein